MKNKDYLFKLLLNATKIVLATIISIKIAELFGLRNVTSAGIIAILSIQPTKKDTLTTSILKVQSYVSAIIIAYISFLILGINDLSFALYLVVYVLLSFRLNWVSSIAMNTVLISHFLVAKDISISMLINESLLFIIGVGAGLIASLHLKKDKNSIEFLKDYADLKIVRYLVHISNSVSNKELLAEGEEIFASLNEDIEKASIVADENFKNQFKDSDTFDIDYIKMRRKQAHILYEMDKIALNISTKTLSTKMIENFIKEVALEFSKDNTVETLIKKFNALDTDIKSKPLPVTRMEFEDRARLFTILRLLEEFLQIKADFVKNGK
jgi:hypothetical protein